MGRLKFTLSSFRIFFFFFFFTLTAYELSPLRICSLQSMSRYIFFFFFFVLFLFGNGEVENKLERSYGAIRVKFSSVLKFSSCFSPGIFIIFIFFFTKYLRICIFNQLFIYLLLLSIVCFFLFLAFLLSIAIGLKC